MRVLQVYNQQRSLHGGEEAVVEATVALLRRRRIDVHFALKSSRGMETSLWWKAKGAASGFYNPFARAEIAKLIRTFRPDVLHAHNIFPDWSPAIFGAAAAAGVATVMSVHSQILTCPTWYHLRDYRICEECLGGREHRCLVNRCRGSLAESAVYAARGFFVRRSGMLARNVGAFIAMSDFMRARLVTSGIPEARVVVAPNWTRPPAEPAAPQRNDYIAFAGRLSPEKGLDVLLAAASRLPGVSFKCAGDGPEAAAFARRRPANVECVGALDAGRLAAFYRAARAVLVPSIAYETFSMVTLEAMAHGVPVIGSAIGAIPELIGKDEAGLLFPPGDVDAAVERIARVMGDDALCAALGEQARARSTLYSEARHLEGLMAAYRLAAHAAEAHAPRAQKRRHAV